MKAWVKAANPQFMGMIEDVNNKDLSYPRPETHVSKTWSSLLAGHKGHSCDTLSRG